MNLGQAVILGTLFAAVGPDALANAPAVAGRLVSEPSTWPLTAAALALPFVMWSMFVDDRRRCDAERAR